MKLLETLKQKFSFQKLFGKLLSFCFGMFWMMIVFKAFNFSFMANLSWWTICVPVIFFLITSLSYIILVYAFVKWFKIKPQPLTKEHENLIKRRFHLDRKNPTRIEKMAKFFILIFSIIIAILILL